MWIFYIFTHPSELFWSSWRRGWSCTFTWSPVWVSKLHRRNASLQGFASQFLLQPCSCPSVLAWHLEAPRESPEAGSCPAQCSQDMHSDVGSSAVQDQEHGARQRQAGTPSTATDKIFACSSPGMNQPWCLSNCTVYLPVGCCFSLADGQTNACG